MSTQGLAAAQANKSRRRQIQQHRQGVSTSSSRDASEEDNDEQTDDAASVIYSSNIAMPDSGRHAIPPSPLKGSGARRLPGTIGVQARLAEASDADFSGVDSPTYDGDVDSTHLSNSLAQANSQAQQHGRPNPLRTAAGGLSNASTDTSAPRESAVQRDLTPPKYGQETSPRDAISHPLPHSAISPSILAVRTLKPKSSDLGPPKMTTPPAHLPVEDIRAFVRRAVEGKGEVDGVIRTWKTSEPPSDRPVRIYADGVYDLFHFGHALQLRQAKLSFPNVHLVVGVCSDALCAEQKSGPAMTHAERCEAVSHCRWVDEVAPDAPWQIDQAWIDRYEIDYVAHDELVYAAKGVVDVYDFVKKQGKFLPTRRTPSISTSDLLERIVRGYRDGFFDSKLEKNGHPELMASDVDWDSSGSVDRIARRKAKAAS